MKKRREMEIFCFFLACTEVIFSIEGGLFKIYEISHDPLDGDISSNRSYKLMLLFVDRLKRQSSSMLSEKNEMCKSVPRVLPQCFLLPCRISLISDKIFRYIWL